LFLLFRPTLVVKIKTENSLGTELWRLASVIDELLALEFSAFHLSLHDSNEAHHCRHGRTHTPTPNIHQNTRSRSIKILVEIKLSSTLYVKLSVCNGKYNSNELATRTPHTVGSPLTGVRFYNVSGC